MLGAGIKLKHIAKDWTHIRVVLPLRWYNRNIVGVQYGGSLYSMADPWFMLMLMQILGKDYIVWDQAATIHFKQPGRSTVSADFRITEQQIQEIKAHVQQHGKGNFTMQTQVLNPQNEVIATVEKVLYVRYKKFIKA